MNETRPSDRSLRRFIGGFRPIGAILRGGLVRNVRSSLRVSVGFESSIGLIAFYAFLSYQTFEYLKTLGVNSALSLT